MPDQRISPQISLPTDFTRAIGARIRTAREERGLTQRRLAQRITRRQATISDFERGMMQPDATTLVVLAEELQKPITYFFPSPWAQQVTRGDLTYDEQALLLEFRRLKNEEHQKLAITLVNALATFELER